MEPVVSVIMPVYNAGTYLVPAIESVLHQTYQNFELILVNDGATDGSGEICEAYARKDSRVILFAQKNKGICAARNIGIFLAKGKYIAFCDHDDLYLPQYLDTAVATSEKNNTEILKFTFKAEIWNEGRRTHAIENKLPDKILRVNELCNSYHYFNLAIRGIWNGLYLRKPIVEHAIVFDETIKSGMEDYLFNLELLKVVHSVSMISDTLFVHFARYGQSTSEKYNPARYADIVLTEHVEARFLLRVPGFSNANWIRHQSQYLIIYLRTLMNPENDMPWHLKKKNLAALNTSDKFKLRCGRSAYITAIKKYRKDAFISFLFHFHFYSFLLLVYGIHRKKQL